MVWCTPWVNLDSRDGQIPPQPESERLHREPASNYPAGARRGSLRARPRRRTVRHPVVDGQWIAVDLTSAAAEEWWRAQVKAVLSLGVEGIKADDGDGYYIADQVQCSLTGVRELAAAWALGGLHRLSLQRALDEVHPGRGVLFGRSGWTSQHATGLTWAGDQASDFWSLRVLVIATLAAACSGYSNWSHDVGGYLGHRLVERCPPELLVRWLQFGCFTPLMQAHARMAQEPWHYGERVLNLYRAYVLLHEQLVPYTRAAAATAPRSGLPIIRPLCLVDPADPRGWTITDAYGYGPALWVAPVLDDGAREREVALPRGEWIETWSGARSPAARRLSCRRRCIGSRCGCGSGRSSSAIRRRTWHEGSGTCRSRPAARGDTVGHAAARERGGATGRRDSSPLASWAVVDQPQATARRSASSAFGWLRSEFPRSGGGGRGGAGEGTSTPAGSSSSSTPGRHRPDRHLRQRRPTPGSGHRLQRLRLAHGDAAARLEHRTARPAAARARATPPATSPAGLGWYRKTFTLPASRTRASGSRSTSTASTRTRTSISTGSCSGNHAYGYTGFSFDVSEPCTPTAGRPTCSPSSSRPSEPEQPLVFGQRHHPPRPPDRHRPGPRRPVRHVRHDARPRDHDRVWLRHRPRRDRAVRTTAARAPPPRCSTRSATRPAR